MGRRLFLGALVGAVQVLRVVLGRLLRRTKKQEAEKEQRFRTSLHLCEALARGFHDPAHQCPGRADRYHGPAHQCSGPGYWCYGSDHHCPGPAQWCCGPDRRCSGPAHWWSRSSNRCPGPLQRCDGPNRRCCGSRHWYCGSAEKCGRAAHRWSPPGDTSEPVSVRRDAVIAGLIALLGLVGPIFKEKWAVRWVVFLSRPRLLAVRTSISSDCKISGVFSGLAPLHSARSLLGESTGTSRSCVPVPIDEAFEHHGGLEVPDAGIREQRLL